LAENAAFSAGSSNQSLRYASPIASVSQGAANQRPLPPGYSHRYFAARGWIVFRSTTVGSQSVSSRYSPFVAPRPIHWLSPIRMSNRVRDPPNSRNALSW
jgi:hypothetical protein